MADLGLQQLGPILLPRLRLPEALIALALVSLAIAAPPCVEASLAPREAVAQTGPGCLVAALTMALQAAGDDRASYADVSLQTVVHRDGAGFFEALLTVEKRGLHALAVQGGPELVAAALRAGIAPVAAVHGREGRHAVYVEAARCGSLTVRDPLSPEPRPVSHAAFVRWQSARQLLLVYRDPARLDRLPSALRRRLALVDRRFRGEGWLRKAMAEPDGTKGRCVFMNRALEADPSRWPGVTRSECR